MKKVDEILDDKYPMVTETCVTDVISNKLIVREREAFMEGYKIPNPLTKNELAILLNFVCNDAQLKANAKKEVTTEMYDLRYKLRDLYKNIS